MAIYHVSMKVIGRQARKGGKVVPGRHNSAVAASAYQGGLKLRDERNQKVPDYSRKGGVAFTTVLLPDGAPEWMHDPERLWNAVEFKEDESNRHANAQLARHLEFALPVELTPQQNRALALQVGGEFVKRGMVAQVSVHEPEARNGQRNPHAHVLLTMREVTPEGFGKKNREWNGGWMAAGAPDGVTLKDWRAMIADHTNAALAQAGHAARIDARSFRDLGLDQVPTVHQGKEATALQRRGERTRLGDKQKVVQVMNASRHDGRLEAIGTEDGDAGGGSAGDRQGRDIYARTFAARSRAAREKPPEPAPDDAPLCWQVQVKERERGKEPEPER